MMKILAKNKDNLITDYHQRKVVSSGFPNYLVIETTNNCNLQCIMCPRPQMTRKTGFMDLGLFKKIIDEIEGKTEFIYLHFFGEPLLHKQLFEFIEYASGKGMTVALSTNASFLNADIADQLLDSRLDMLIISIDSVQEETYNQIRVNGDFALTMKQVEDFLARYSAKKPALNVSLQLIKMGLNDAEIGQFRGKWKAASGINTVVKGLHDYASQVGKIESMGYKKNPNNGTKHCVENWRSLVIGWDGIVVPCCNDYDYKYPLGNTNSATISEIWNSPAMQELRRAQIEGRQSGIELCKGCSIPTEEKQRSESVVSGFNPSMLESQSYFNKGLYLEGSELFTKDEFELLVQDRFNDVTIVLGRISEQTDGMVLSVRLFDKNVGAYQVDAETAIHLKTPEEYKGRLLRYSFHVSGNEAICNSNSYLLKIISVVNERIVDNSLHRKLGNKMEMVKKLFSSLLANTESRQSNGSEAESLEQNLTPYWDSNFIESLETWGEGNAWHEIKFIASGCHGKILDIACGTGKVMELLKIFPQLDLYGCDISDMLISKAVQRGLPENRLVVTDATRMDYSDNFFDFSYSIGSLEHFTEEGIEQCIAECYRVTMKSSFHLVPVSKSGLNEGWMTTTQSFHNNQVDWWLNKFKSVYQDVVVLDSLWQDDISDGKWFVCIKNGFPAR
jgi:radical SAM protein with 4Fe4S-binding SPASM domain